MAKPDEFQIQRAYMMWFCGVPGKIEPAGLPGVVCWHTPNGGSRDVREATRLKELGVMAGIPDVAHLWGGVFFIEFKRPGGVLSAVQRALHPRLLAAGAKVATVDSLAAAKDQARSWGIVRDGC